MVLGRLAVFRDAACEFLQHGMPLQAIRCLEAFASDSELGAEPHMDQAATLYKVSYAIISSALAPSV